MVEVFPVFSMASPVSSRTSVEGVCVVNSLHGLVQSSELGFGG